MQTDHQNSENDSGFTHILSQKEHDQYLFLKKYHITLQIQQKQQFRKVFALAQSTIDLEEQKTRLTAKIIEKDTKIKSLTCQLQQMKVIMKVQIQSLKSLKQDFENKIFTKDNEILQQKRELQEKTSLKQQNQYFHELAKDLNAKLIKINKILSEEKLQAEYIQEEEINMEQREKIKADEVYQSIIMQQDSEVDKINQNIAEVLHNIKIIMKSEKVRSSIKKRQSFDKQLEVIEAQNASLQKRVSRLQHQLHQIGSELNIGVIRRKFKGILDSESYPDGKEIIAQRWFQLTQQYIKCISEEYDNAVCGLFKEEDHYDEVMQQVRSSVKVNFPEFT